MSINNRVFGSDIPNKVKKTLEARQLAAQKTRNPNEQINPSKYPDDREDYYNYGELLDNQFNGEADLSSRTPFIRMWTAVQLGIYEDTDEDDDIVLYEGQFVEMANENNELLAAEMDAAQSYKDQVLMAFPKSVVTSIFDGDKIKYIVKRPEINIDLSNPKVYMIGNHTLNTTDQITPQQQIVADAEEGPNQQTAGEKFNALSDTEQKDYLTGEMFPNEHGVRNDVNKFLKPAAGITSVTSTTEGALGERKSTTINFEVHNFADYDAIYNRYFLRPGAQIFIDFGWSSVKELYNPNNIIGFADDDGSSGNEKIIERLYGEKENGDDQDGVVTKSKGNLEVLIGQVTNYDSKITENGSVQCSLTIQSANVAMLTFPKLEALKHKIDFLLDNFFQFEALYNFGVSKNEKGELVNRPDSKFIPDSNSSVRDIANFEENIFEEAKKTFGSTDFNPTVLASVSGIFLPGGDNVEGYTSIGFLEDKILNAEFAFGKNIEDINNVEIKGLSTKMDSSNEFTSYIPSFHEKQSIIGNTGESEPMILIPRFWDRTYNTITKHSPAGLDIFNSKNYDFDDFFDEDIFTDFNKEFDSWIATTDEKLKEMGKDKSYFDFYPYETPITNYDKNINSGDEASPGRIPIREIFVNNKIIKEAFGSISKSFKDIVNHILKSINEDSYGVFDFKLAGGQDNLVKIIDRNYLNVDNTVTQDIFNNLFTFDIMSPTSIVKSYNVSLALPDDTIGANVAIQALSGTNAQLLPINEEIVTATSLAEIFRGTLDNEASELSAGASDLKKITKVKYLPEIGGLRGKNLSNSDGEKQFLNYYKNYVNSSANDLYLQTSYGNIVDTETAFDSQDDGDDEDEKKPSNSSAKINTRIIDANNSLMIKNNFFLSETFSEHFRARIAGDILFKKNPPLPIKLELTTYGISSLVPGDIFTVDYLPKMYLKTTYFQVIKVSHSVGTDGWYTTLETVFRFRKKLSSKDSIQGNYRGYALSANVFSTFKIDDSQAYSNNEDKTFNYSVRRINSANYGSGLNATKLAGRGYRLGGVGGRDGGGHGSSKSHIDGLNQYTISVPAVYSFKENLKTLTNGISPLGEGKTISIIQNFSEALSYMLEITPVEIPSSFTYVSQIFKFKVSCPKDEGIILISPMYYSNTSQMAIKRYHNGYGGRNFPIPMTGLYYNGDEVFLIFNKSDPSKFYGYIPAIKYDDRPVSSAQDTDDTFVADFTSVNTPDFLKYFGKVIGIDKTSGGVLALTKRMEDETAGSYDQ